MSPETLDSAREQKLIRLREILRYCGRVLVAYSGGVDSALVMRIAHQELGSRALACIGVSPSYPEREMRDAVKLVEAMGAPYRLVPTQEHLDSRYAANPSNRCYFCKSELHDRLHAIAAAEGWDTIMDGTHTGDLADVRPGIAAARERGVRSPLLEAGLDKADVRALARHLGMPVWDKPAMPCLSSRVPTGIAITPELLNRIEAAEDVLAGLGFRQFRVRHHGDVARIEVEPEDFARLLEHRDEIVSGVRAAGYRFVALDLCGLKSGSLVQLTPPVARAAARDAT